MSRYHLPLAAALAGAAALSAGCGGGGGGGGIPEGPVPLQSKSDALRELAMALGNNPLANLIDGASFSTGSSLAKAVTVECTEGSYDYETGSTSRDFSLLNPPATNISVSYGRYTESRCKDVLDNDSVQYIEFSDGVYEAGNFGSQPTPGFAPYKYKQYGASGKAHFFSYEIRSGDQRQFYESFETRGTVEERYANQLRQQATRAMIDSVLEENGERRRYSAIIGTDGAPFRVTAPPDGSRIQLDGNFAYGTNSASCPGGRVRISTPSEGGIGLTDRYPSQGQLRVESGTNSAVFTFAGDGSATVQINGGSGIEVSAEEVRAALDEPYCS